MTESSGGWEKSGRHGSSRPGDGRPREAGVEGGRQSWMGVGAPCAREWRREEAQCAGNHREVLGGGRRG
jgi:hypothetical protein